MFFSPIFLFVLKLEPNGAIGPALLTDLFGFSSGWVQEVAGQALHRLGVYSLDGL